MELGRTAFGVLLRRADVTSFLTLGKLVVGSKLPGTAEPMLGACQCGCRPRRLSSGTGRRFSALPAPRWSRARDAGVTAHAPPSRRARAHLLGVLELSGTTQSVLFECCEPCADEQLHRGPLHAL